MSVDVVIHGIKEKDEIYNTMKKIYDICKEANVSIPKEVQEYFQYDCPDSNGIIVDIEDAITINCTFKTRTIDLSKIPKSVKQIKVYLC